MGTSFIIHKKMNFALLIIILLTLLPFPYLIGILIGSDNNFPDYLLLPLLKSFGNGFVLVILTSLFSLLWAVPSAFLLRFYHFRLKKLLVALMILPIAIPSYLNAYVYSDLFYYSGIISEWYFNLTGYKLPFNIHSNIGVGFVLSLSLYPYIFFPLYMRLRKLPTSIIDYARTVGLKKVNIALKTILPMILPVIIFGLSLITLETLSDYGTVSYYGVSSPALFLFDVWHQTANISNAVKITLIFLVITGAILLFNHSLQKNKLYNSPKITHQLHDFVIHRKINLFLSYGWIVLIFTLSFLVPVIFFMSYFILTPLPSIDLIKTLSFYSTIPAITAAMLCVMAGFLMSFINFHQKKGLLLHRCINFLIALCTSGYAFPGVILGIAIYSGLIMIDKQIIATFDASSALFSGGILGMIFCYYIKFLTVSHGVIEPVFKTISPSILQSSILTGRTPFETIKTVYFPFFHKPFIIGFILVTVDIIKELPATLILKPFGVETFATYTYNMVGLERLHEASSAALIMILTGVIAALIPIFFHIIKDSDAENW